MKERWRNLSSKFLLLSGREQALIFACILVVTVFLPFNLVIDGNLVKLAKEQKSLKTLKRKTKNLDTLLFDMEYALKQDPNAPLTEKLTQYNKRIEKIDEQLLKLTEELVNPIQMRNALIQLLKSQPGVAITSFEVKPAEPLIFSEKPDSSDKSINIQGEKNIESVGLYKHAIEVKLRGKYFQLRDYLLQVENLPWQFFWHQFEYQLKDYPLSELTIELYSLSTNKEFIGV